MIPANRLAQDWRPGRAAEAACGLQNFNHIMLGLGFGLSLCLSRLLRAARGVKPPQLMGERASLPGFATGFFTHEGGQPPLQSPFSGLLRGARGRNRMRRISR